MAEGDQKKEQTENKQKSAEHANARNLVLVGGVVGASAGLLASPENGKKVVSRISQSELMRSTGREIRRTVQNMLREQAMSAIRQSATGYMRNVEGQMLGKSNKSIEEKLPEAKEVYFSEQYNELKKENKNLNENMQRIEEKLDVLLNAGK